MRWLRKNIEIYDGNYGYHYVRKFGLVVQGIAILLFISTPVISYFNRELALAALVLSLALFMLGLL